MGGSWPFLAEAFVGGLGWGLVLAVWSMWGSLPFPAGRWLSWGGSWPFLGEVPAGAVAGPSWVGLLGLVAVASGSILKHEGAVSHAEQRIQHDTVNGSWKNMVLIAHLFFLAWTKMSWRSLLTSQYSR